VTTYTRALGTGLLWLSALTAFALLVAGRKVALDIRGWLSG
jgi:hypothetical protein